MRRREFLAAAAGALTFQPSFAQQLNTPRVGWLTLAPHPNLAPFLAGLRDLGWIEGRNLIMEYGYAEGQRERLPGVAADLQARGAVVIVATGSAAALAAHAEIRAVPIVVVVSDPISLGLVTNIARPESNITGFALLNREMNLKRVEALQEALPSLARVAILADPAADTAQFAALSNSVQALGMDIFLVEMRTAAELEEAFLRAKRGNAGAVIIASSPFAGAHRDRLIALSAQHRLPGMYEQRDWVAAGGFLSYGANYGVVFRRAAAYVDRLLKGAKPADLPIEQPTRIELAINLKTARTLGLSLPSALLARADEVIE
jgi:putative ABC transport system substrate-binding protein